MDEHQWHYNRTHAPEQEEQITFNCDVCGYPGNNFERRMCSYCGLTVCTECAVSHKWISTDGDWYCNICQFIGNTN